MCLQLGPLRPVVADRFTGASKYLGRRLSCSAVSFRWEVDVVSERVVLMMELGDEESPLLEALREIASEGPVTGAHAVVTDFVADHLQGLLRAVEHGRKSLR